MSGIPRAKSCINCQKRKRKCDRTRPTCSICQKNGNTCVYTQRPHVFFVSGADPTAESSHGSFQMVAHRAAAPMDLSYSVKHTNFRRTALESQLQQAFWSHYLPTRDPGLPAVPEFTVSSKLSHIQHLSDTQPLVRQAVDACALTFLGRLHDDENLVRYGMQVYGRALITIQGSIQRLDRRKLESIISACRLLSLYEMVRPDVEPGLSIGRDWRRHAQAACRLTEMLDPSELTSGPGLALFNEARLLALRLNLLDRKPGYFCGPKWQNLRSQTSPNDPQAALHDIMMISIPTVLEKSDTLFAGLDPISRSADDTDLLSAGRMLLHEYLSLSERLRGWEREVLAAHQMSNLDLVTSAIAQEDLFVPYSGEHNAHARSRALLLVVNQYWGCCLLVFSQVQRVVSRLREAFPGEISMPVMPDWMNPWPYANNIAASAPSLLSPSAGVWVSEQSGFPIGAALHFFAAFDAVDCPEMVMLKREVRLPKLSALTNGFLKSVVADAVPADSQGDMDLDEEHSRMVKRWYGGVIAGPTG